MVLICDYSYIDLGGQVTPQFTEVGVRVPYGHQPFGHTAVPQYP